jgi:hypothetical protein
MTTSSALLSHDLTKKPREKWVVEALICVTILATISFRVLGWGTALDAIAAFISPVLIPFAWKHRDLRRFVVLVALWIASILVSDQVHGVGFGRTLGGLALPALLGLSVMMLSWLAKGSPARLRAVVVGAVLSHLIVVLVNGTTFFDINPWKYGLALPVTLLALALVAGPSKSSTRLSVIVLAASAVYSFMNDYRSMAGIAAAATVILLVLRRPAKRVIQHPTIKPGSKPSVVISKQPVIRARKATKPPRRKHPMIQLFLGLLVVVYAAYASYALAASEGLLPDEAQAKYQAQVQQGNLLVAARPEVVGSFFAVKASPLLGLGTGGKLDAESQTEALNVLSASGAMIANIQQVRLFGDGVNSHSLLFSGWVSSGILGALPWAFMLYLGMRAIAYRRPGSEMLPLAVFWALAASWDILFSPYQPHLHILLAAFVVLVTWKQPVEAEQAPVIPGSGDAYAAKRGTALRAKNLVPDRGAPLAQDVAPPAAQRQSVLIRPK